MDWQLDPDASFCIASRRAIFLHAGLDRYLALPDPLNAAFLAWLEAPGTRLPDALAAMLETAKILTPATKNALHPVTPFACEIARQGLGRELKAKVSPALLAAVALAFWRTKRVLQRRGFAGLLDPLPRPRISISSDADTHIHAGQFLRAKAMLSIREDCLVDSLAMLGYLRQRGCQAQAVFGVTAVPFQAHCWVQSNGVLLNDAFDNVSAFTPIRAQ